MFIYILEKVYAWDDKEVLGYYSTEEKAEKAKKKWTKDFQKCIEITKVKLK